MKIEIVENPLIDRLAQGLVSENGEYNSFVHTVISELYTKEYKESFEDYLLANIIFSNVTYTDVDSVLNEIASACVWSDYNFGYRSDVRKGSVKRIIGEIVQKCQKDAFGVLAANLGKARTEGKGHIIPSCAKINGQPRKLTIEDLNYLKILNKRINTTWNNGLIRGEITDLFLSPELMAEIKKWNYSAGESTLKDDSSLSLPNDIREQIFKGAGRYIWGIQLHEMAEFELGNKGYNNLFHSFFEEDNGRVEKWNSEENEILIGVDRNADAFYRQVNRKDGNVMWFENLYYKTKALTKTGEEIDDFKIGFTGFTRQAWEVTNDKAIVGLLV